MSIAAKESAVVPIMSLSIKGKRVLVFDPKENEVNATKAVHLYNTSDVVLSNGNVSVLEGGRFVQQTPFTPMLPSDDQLVPCEFGGTQN